MPNMTDPEHPKAPDSSRRIGRKELNTYMHKLFGSPVPTNVRPDYTFSDDKGRYHLEVFLDTPDGMILAVHLDSGPAGEVDVLTFRKVPDELRQPYSDKILPLSRLKKKSGQPAHSMIRQSQRRT